MATDFNADQLPEQIIRMPLHSPLFGLVLKLIQISEVHPLRLFLPSILYGGILNSCLELLNRLMLVCNTHFLYLFTPFNNFIDNFRYFY